MAEPRRKRKERGGTGGAAGASHADGAPANGTRTPPRPGPRERMEAGYAKAEVRNRAAREALVPLADGERPPVVTVSAVLAALVALSIVIAFAAGLKVNGAKPHLTTAAAPALIMCVLAWGMWRARYWAVVCFQAVLAFLIFAAVYALLVEANSVTGFAVTVGLLAVCGTLFWKMVKAMARIQMPDRARPR
ncbi:MAG: hypothetical protein JSS68_02685 [Actinobacteria bacterium]|nr:hypothetical protein [Actinomycetota bacterium]